MNNEEIAAVSGQRGAEKVAAYKLNEVKLNGRDGAYVLREVLSEKQPDGRYPPKPLGDKIYGVILKMRWRLYKYNASAKSILSSEFDDKNTDTVVLFGSNEKGVAAALKEKYQLGSQRILYTYIPHLKEVVRVIVKPSALSGDKNTNGEFGLFEYVDAINTDKKYLHEWLTEFSLVERTEPVKYYAMAFKAQKEVTDPENKAKMVEFFKDVHERTKQPFAETYDAPAEEVETTEEVSPDDIPF